MGTVISHISVDHETIRGGSKDSIKLMTWEIFTSITAQIIDYSR